MEASNGHIFKPIRAATTLCLTARKAATAPLNAHFRHHREERVRCFDSLRACTSSAARESWLLLAASPRSPGTGRGTPLLITVFETGSAGRETKQLPNAPERRGWRASAGACMSRAARTACMDGRLNAYTRSKHRSRRCSTPNDTPFVAFLFQPLFR